MVAAAVTITSQPVPLTTRNPHSASSTSSFSISVSATGGSPTDPLKYQWFKYGVDPLTNDTVTFWPKSVDRSKAALDISNILFSDTGWYRCKITQGKGAAEISVFSSAAQLQVNTDANSVPTWFSEESNRELIAPTVMTQLSKFLLVKWLLPSGNGHAMNSYQVEYKTDTNAAWRVGKSAADAKLPFAVIEGKDLDFSTSASLWTFRVKVISSNTKVSYSGELSGVIKDPERPEFSASLTTTPTLDTSGEQAVVSNDPYKSITISAGITGKPAPVLRWFRNGLELNTTSSGLANYTIDVANKSHDGLYTISATNYLGSVSSEAVKVLVNTPPWEEKPRAAVASKLILQCEAAGDVKQFAWFRDTTHHANGSAPLDLKAVDFSDARLTTERSGSWLVLTGVHAYDQGKYQCQAQNSACLHMQTVQAGYACPTSALLAVEVADCGEGEYRQDGNGYCQTCAQGQYQQYASHKEPACISCPQGYAQGKTAAVECSGCEQGLYTDQPGLPTCSSCQAGRYAINVSSVRCVDCEVAKFSQSAGAVSCLYCPNGQSQIMSGKTSCADCEARKYSSVATGHVCRECELGHYSTDVGAASCKECQAGRYQDKKGMEYCNPCPLHTYGEALGFSNEAQCKPCGAAAVGAAADYELVTLAVGANSSALCVCPSFSFDTAKPGDVQVVALSNLSSNASVEPPPLRNCELCPVGAQCDAPGSQLVNLAAEPGWWRLTKISGQFYQCGSVSQGGNQYECAGGIVEQQCVNNTRGVLCSQCVDDYLRYDGDMCKPCPDDKGLPIVSSTMPVGGLLAIAFFAWLLMRPDAKGKLTKGLQATKDWKKKSKAIDTWTGMGKSHDGIATKLKKLGHKDEGGLSPEELEERKKKKRQAALMLTAASVASVNSATSTTAAVLASRQETNMAVNANAAAGTAEDAGTDDGGDDGGEDGGDMDGGDMGDGDMGDGDMDMDMGDEDLGEMMEEMEEAAEEADGAVADAQDMAADVEGGLAGTFSSSGGGNMRVGMGGLQSKIKSLLTWGQCLGGFGKTFTIPWPAAFSTQLDFAFNIFSLDPLALFTVNVCDLDTSFFSKYQIMILVMPAIVFIILCAVVVAQLVIRYKHRKAAKKGEAPSDEQIHLKTEIARVRATRYILAIVFLFYPPVCSKVFLVWKCDQYGDKYFLNQDLSVECFVGEHRTYIIISVILVFVYVLGVPLTLLKLMYDRKKQIQLEPENALLKEQYGSLYQEYEPNCWWFEIAQMFRKMLLTGGLIAVQADDSLTIMVGILVCFIYLLLLTNWGPFIEDDDDKMEQVAAVQLFITILMGLVLQLQQLSDQPSDPLFGIILVTMNVGVLFCALFLMMKVCLGMGGTVSTLKASSKKVGISLVTQMKLTLAKKRTEKASPSVHPAGGAVQDATTKVNGPKKSEPKTLDL